MASESDGRRDGESHEGIGCLGAAVVFVLVAFLPGLLHRRFAEDECVVADVAGVAFLVLTVATIASAVCLLLVKWRPGKRLAAAMMIGWVLGVLMNVLVLTGGC